MRSKDAWWESNWLWGGVAPILPAVAFLVAASLKLGSTATLVLVCLAAAPMIWVLGTALLLIGRQFVDEFDVWLHRND